MALLTPMSLDQARGLGAAYGLQVTAVTAWAQGVNSNFRWEIDGGRPVFARVYEGCSRQHVADQCRLVAELAAAGVPTPVPLELQDGSGVVGEVRGKPVALFPLVPGEMCCQAAVEPAKAERVGRALARIHRAGDGGLQAPAERGGVAQQHAWIAELRCRALPPVLGRDVEMLGAELDELLALRGPEPGPATVIHGDLFRDNVLWYRGELGAVLDFEFAAMGSPVFDLMVTLLAWCFSDRLEPELGRALCRGYRTERPLSRTEVDQCMVQAQLAALRFAISRIADYELRPREAIAYKDYRRYRQRLVALRQLGGRQLAEWVGGGGAAG